jgi:hypothetical protein
MGGRLRGCKLLTNKENLLTRAETISEDENGTRRGIRLLLFLVTGFGLGICYTIFHMATWRASLRWQFGGLASPWKEVLWLARLTARFGVAPPLPLYPATQPTNAVEPWSADDVISRFNASVTRAITWLDGVQN